jgi:hypothetical protein
MPVRHSGYTVTEIGACCQGLALVIGVSVLSTVELALAGVVAHQQDPYAGLLAPHMGRA